MKKVKTDIISTFEWLRWTNNVFWRLKTFCWKIHHLYRTCGLLFVHWYISVCLSCFCLCVWGGGFCMQRLKALVNSVPVIWTSAVGGPIGVVSKRWITVKARILTAHRPAPTKTKRRNADVFPALTAKVSAIYTYAFSQHKAQSLYNFD